MLAHQGTGQNTHPHTSPPPTHLASLIPPSTAQVIARREANKAFKRQAEYAYDEIADEDLVSGDDSGSDDDGEEEVVPGGGYRAGGYRAMDDSENDVSEEDEEEGGHGGGGKAKKNPLIVNERKLSRPSAAEAREESSRAEAAWFGQSLIKGLAGEDDDEEEVAAMAEAARRKRMKQKGGKGKEEAMEEEEETEVSPAEEVPAAAPTTAAAAAKGRKRKATAEDAATTSPSSAASSSAAAAEDDAAPKLRPFIKASKFGGEKVGYVYKRDGKGLGYYLDQPPVPAAAVVQQGGKRAKKGGEEVVAPAAKKEKAASTRIMVGEAVVKPSGKAKSKRAVEEAEEAAEKVMGGVGGGKGNGKKARRGPQSIEDVVPDNAKFRDLEDEEEEEEGGGEEGADGGKKKKVLGVKAAKAAARALGKWDAEMEEEEAERKASATFEESRQAAIERQAEAIVLGQMLLQPGKRRQIEDAAYNRHTKNDRGLPQWFLDDEKKFANPDSYGVELDDGMLDKARNGLKDITARSIGKVAEAKARKQRRMNRALTKLRKKANQIVNKDDLSEREKAREVEKLYKKKVQKNDRKKKTLIIGKRFEAGSAGKKGAGVKMVDRRLKNDARAEKNAGKKGGGGKGGKQGKGGGKKDGGGQSRQKPKGKGGRQKKGANYGRRR